MFCWTQIDSKEKNLALGAATRNVCLNESERSPEAEFVLNVNER